MTTETETLSLNDYQIRASSTAGDVLVSGLLVYPAMGLAGEAGEVVNKVKKIFRDDGGVLTAERRDAIIKELGDVLWYTAEIARRLEIPLEDVAERNLTALQARAKTHLIRGDGDNREVVATPKEVR